MSGREITIESADGSEFMGYQAMPPSSQGPGVVVIQEIFGVNQFMRDLTDWVASEGFVALCPDLFWRQEPGVQIDGQSEEDWARAFELFQGFDLEKGVQDLDASIETLRADAGRSGKVGSVGYCLGGRLAYLTSTRTKADAAVGYYGVSLTEHLDESFGCPLMLHIAGEDEYMPKEGQDQVHAALDGNTSVTLHDYPGQGHAFARVGGEHYDSESTQLANGRTIEFLKAHLG